MQNKGKKSDNVQDTMIAQQNIKLFGQIPLLLEQRAQPFRRHIGIRQNKKHNTQVSAHRGDIIARYKGINTRPEKNENNGKIVSNDQWG